MNRLWKLGDRRSRDKYSRMGLFKNSSKKDMAIVLKDLGPEGPENYFRVDRNATDIFTSYLKSVNTSELFQLLSHVQFRASTELLYSP